MGGAMDIWNPTEEDRKKPEWLRFHVHFLQSGAQQRNDWKYWPRDWTTKPKYTGPKHFDHPHYKVVGCNIHDRSEWVRYVLEKEDSLEERLRKIFK